MHRRSHLLLRGILALVPCWLAACATTDGGSDDTSGSDGGKADDGHATGALTAPQRKVAEELTSIWENDTPVLNYAYAEDIKDGRGYTSGRAGFCTGTGDAIQVIACYDAKLTTAQGNRMAKYMPALKTIDARFNATGEDQGSTAELDAIGSWAADWASSATSATTAPAFKTCQDRVVNRLYYGPAMQAAAKWGLRSALSKAALYDMWINQGDDALIRAANKLVGDTAQVAPVIGYHGITEDEWLKQFLIARRDVMWADGTWKDAVDRVAGYEKQRRRANWDLARSIRNDVHASDCWGAPYTPSGYTIRELAPDGTWTTPTATSYRCD